MVAARRYQSTSDVTCAAKSLTREHMKQNICEIQFRRELCVQIEAPSQKRSRLLQVPKGSRLKVRLVPYHKGQWEVADLHFRDGSIAREVSFAYFTFVD